MVLLLNLLLYIFFCEQIISSQSYIFDDCLTDPFEQNRSE